MQASRYVGKNSADYNIVKLSSRLTIVSREAKKKQRPLSELFTTKKQKTWKHSSQAAMKASA